MIEEPILETTKIQGNILPGFRMPFQFMIACKIQMNSNLNGLLNHILPKLTTMKEALSYHEERISLAKKTHTFGIQSFSLPKQNQLFWINIGFGAKLLTQFINDIDRLGDSFNLGLAARSFSLGDSKESTNEGNKNNWLFGNENKEADIFLITASDKKATLRKEVKALKKTLSEFKIKILYSENGERLGDDSEHFGFKDGISQPEVRGYSNKTKTFLSPRTIITGNDNPNDQEFSAPGKELIWTGQFVFGYPKQSPDHFRNSIEATEFEKSDYIKNGSMLVFRRLKQNVRLFYEDTQKLHEDLITNSGFENISYEDFLSKIVGRSKAGTPLLFDNPATKNEFLNNFNYKSPTSAFSLSNGTVEASISADPEGAKCPMFAHIRKVNPRDLPTDQGAETNTATFRIMRRGIPFGKLYNFNNPSAKSNQKDRGLFFLCYQTSIQQQFELLTSKWMNQDSRPESEIGFDILVGQNNEEDSNGIKWCLFNANGQTKWIEVKQPFVIPTAGGYFFCPSTDAIKLMISSTVL
jgi:Dyp-type peroxidase family